MAKQNEKFIQQFHEQLSCLRGDEINIAAQAYRLICEAEKPAEAFQYFLEHADEMELDGEQEAEIIFQSSELSAYAKIDKLIESIMDEIIDNKPEADDFYTQVWRNLTNEDLFKEEKKRIYAFYCVWMDGRIPYYKLGEGITMTNEEFLDTTLKRKEEVRKAIYIMNTDFKQKTERSSLVMKVLKDCDTDIEEAVVLSQAFSALERRLLRKIVDKIRENKEETTEE